MDDDNPCCAAEALRRIRQIPINGTMTGITMLDESIDDVKEQNFGSDAAVSEALMKKIRIYNYIPPGVAGEYARAIMDEYRRAGKEKMI